MKTDITRQVAAKIYYDPRFRNKILNQVEEPYKAVVKSYGLDIKEILKHAYRAKANSNLYYGILFPLSVLLWGGIFYMLMNPIVAVFLLSIKSLLIFSGFIIGFLFLIVLIGDIYKREFINKHLTKNSFISNFDYKGLKNKTIEEYDYRSRGNLIVYSGYSPFIGSGYNIGGWSFALDIDKGKKTFDIEHTPVGFSLWELYKGLEVELKKLDIPNLQISDKVFVNGQTIRNDMELLPNKLSNPSDHVSDNYMYRVMNGEENQKARFYKVIQIIDWEGDIVFSSFIRFQKSAQNLFVENNYYLLPPVKSEIKAVDDRQKIIGVRGFLKWLFKLFFTMFWHSILSIFKVFLGINSILNKFLGSEKRSLKKKVKSSPSYDYGATSSIRELISQDAYNQHFQLLDKEMYMKIIEKRVFNFIEDFLQTKNIDTSEFKERETSILNNGIIVTGNGKLESKNIAVGKKSKINFFQTK